MAELQKAPNDRFLTCRPTYTANDGNEIIEQFLGHTFAMGPFVNVHFNLPSFEHARSLGHRNRAMGRPTGGGCCKVATVKWSSWRMTVPYLFAPLLKDWMVAFTLTLWHAVQQQFRQLETRGSSTWRLWMSPAFRGMKMTRIDKEEFRETVTLSPEDLTPWEVSRSIAFSWFRSRSSRQASTIAGPSTLRTISSSPFRCWRTQEMYLGEARPYKVQQLTR